VLGLKYLAGFYHQLEDPEDFFVVSHAPLLFLDLAEDLLVGRGGQVCDLLVDVADGGARNAEIVV